MTITGDTKVKEQEGNIHKYRPSFISLLILLILVIYFFAAPASVQTKSMPVTPSTVQWQTFPSSDWPWDKAENENVKWTGGFHSWSKGGWLTLKISASRGNGLDFARGGTAFDVLAMASGIVIVNRCNFISLGW